MDSKTPIDIAAVTAGFGSWFSLLPEAISLIAAILSTVWLIIRILETDTVQAILKKRNYRWIP